MRYRLALDMGTTSLGWAVFRLNDANQPSALIRAGVRIFSDGRHPKDGSSLAVQRRLARGMRRRRDRLLKRKARMMRQLIEYGFFPADEAARKALEREYPNPWQLRAQGLDQALHPGAFARALFHLNQRRGFKSNRKTDTKDKEGSALKSAIRELREQIASNGCRTVGQWLCKRMADGHGIRARYRENRVSGESGKTRIEKYYDLYIDRQMVADEFDALWQVQAGFDPLRFNEQAREALRDTLLYQRPLRPVLPGRCTLLPDESRAPLALPASQHFRIYQELANLRILDGQMHERALTLAERDQVADALETHRKQSFSQLRTLLRLPGSSRFNLEDEKRNALNGNATSVILARQEHFGAQWYQFTPQLQNEIVRQLCEEEVETDLIDWLMTHTGVDEEHAVAIAGASLPDGFGSLSAKALARIVPALKARVCTYDQAVQDAGFVHHSQLGLSLDDEKVLEWVHPETGEIFQLLEKLPYYGKVLQRHVAFGSGITTDPDDKRYGKIANPTVHIALNQVRTVVNALIARYGHPAEVVLEVARDLKSGQKQREEAQKQQASNQKRNERIRKEIAELQHCNPDQVKGRDIVKWILWEELAPGDVSARCCPYSGQQISVSQLLSDKVEIEHILPFSRTLDDSLNNKTVSLREANRIKGNRTPWEAREAFEAAGWPYEEILARSKKMNYRAKGYRFSEDGFEKWQGESGGFLARALNDTRYMSRVAKAYLGAICPGSGVRVIPGRMTSLLRRHLGLNEILGPDGEKNRCDHRHHAVDACVIGVTDQGLLQRFAQASARAGEQGLHKLAEGFEPPWPTYRDHVQRAIDNIWVSHRPDHGYQGSLMEDTAHGIGRDGSIKQRKKEGREIKNLIRIAEPSLPERHGVDEDGNPLPYKGYVGGSNDCIEIYRQDNGKWAGDVISTFQAYQIVRRDGLARLRHPSLAQNGRPLVMRLIRNDLVIMGPSRGQAPDRKPELLRVVQLSANGKITLAPVHEANVDARNRDKEDPFSYIFKLAGSLQKARGRRVSLSPIGELRDPGFPG